MAEKVVPEGQAAENTGSINISNDVVSIVASLAASSVKGVSGMVSSISGGFAELLGKKNMSKGVKVSVTDKKATLDLAIIVEYGAKIPDVAWEIQEKVKSEVEAMTGLNVAAVNVSVEGVNVPKDDTASQPVSNIKEEAENIAESAKEKLGDFMENAADKAEDVIEGVKDAAEDIKDKAVDIKDKAEDIKDDIKDKAEDIVDAVKDAAEDIFD